MFTFLLGYSVDNITSLTLPVFTGCVLWYPHWGGGGGGGGGDHVIFCPFLPVQFCPFSENRVPNGQKRTKILTFDYIFSKICNRLSAEMGSPVNDHGPFSNF